MGTPAYMSPEQAKGAKVDKRADIWAFGCVLFEMLAGRPPFAGETAAETLAAVLHHEPPWIALPPDTPAARPDDPDTLSRQGPEAARPRHRRRPAGAGRRVHVGCGRTACHPGSAGPCGGAPARFLPRWSSAAWSPQSRCACVRRTRLHRSHSSRSASTGPAALNVNGNERDLTITPDGSRVVYVGDWRAGRSSSALWASSTPVSIKTGAVLRNPFISPDGQWVGFGEELVRAEEDADRRRTGHHDRPYRFDLARRHLAGGQHDRVRHQQPTHRLAARLRRRRNADAPDQAGHGARRVRSSVADAAARRARASLHGHRPLRRTRGRASGHLRSRRQDAPRHCCPAASNAVYVPSGHLAYVAGGALWAVPFDPDRRTTSGTPVPVLKDVVTTGNGAGIFDVSPNGTLVYGHASRLRPVGSNTELDRSTREDRADSGARRTPISQPKISHDGTRVVTTHRA